MVEIFTKRITLRNGKVLTADECGINVFHFTADEDTRKDDSDESDD